MNSKKFNFIHPHSASTFKCDGPDMMQIAHGIGDCPIKRIIS